MSLERMVVPFRSWHMEWINAAYVIDGTELAREVHNSWTGVVHGSPIACAGTVTHWPGRHYAWAVLGSSTAPHMRWITREVLRRLDELKGRIEMTVLVDFKAGHRWAKMLGFEVETPCMKGYGPVGESHAMYVRFN